MGNQGCKLDGDEELDVAIDYVPADACEVIAIIRAEKPVGAPTQGHVRYEGFRRYRVDEAVRRLGVMGPASK